MTAVAREPCSASSKGRPVAARRRSSAAWKPNGGDLLFVLADEQHLTDAGALMHRIAQEALDQHKGANIVSRLAVAALEASRMKTAAQAIAAEARDRAAKQADLVIWVDEAQTVDRTFGALPSAHKGGLGVPGTRRSFGFAHHRAQCAVDSRPVASGGRCCR